MNLHLQTKTDYWYRIYGCSAKERTENVLEILENYGKSIEIKKKADKLKKNSKDVKKTLKKRYEYRKKK